MSAPRAVLMDLAGRGYAVVESLPSLGKGRSCSGLFITEASHREALDGALRERRKVVFEGVVHSRQSSAPARLPVEITRVDLPEGGEVTVEFTARDVAYDLVG